MPDDVRAQAFAAIELLAAHVGLLTLVGNGQRQQPFELLLERI